MSILGERVVSKELPGSMKGTLLVTIHFLPLLQEKKAEILEVTCRVQSHSPLSALVHETYYDCFPIWLEPKALSCFNKVSSSSQTTAHAALFSYRQRSQSACFSSKSSEALSSCQTSNPLSHGLPAPEWLERRSCQ
jgi:hypothetical protein